MDCWTVLQLADDADERTIKRTYARLLKSCRPDDDAEGFQRLREAYEQALSEARWRADNEELETVEAPVAEQAHGNLSDLAELMDVRPLGPAPFEPPVVKNAYDLAELMNISPLSPAAFEAPKPDPALALLTGLNVHNLDERWALAQQQGCEEAFQAGLLRHCFEAPGERSAIVSWAMQHLEWLTPWQRVTMTPWQHEALTSELLQDYRSTLQELLEQKAEREFVNQLTQYNSQPWLRVFDQQQQWQRIVLQLLHETQWSVPLFERVCSAFGWDDQKGVYPEPAWMWRGLVSRCEQESFYEHLQTKAQDTTWKSADAMAARLLLTPLSETQQHRMTASFSNNDWNACQQLAETLNWRYPQLLERLPQTDVFFWRKFLPRPMSHHSWVQVWSSLALATALAVTPHTTSNRAAEAIMLVALTFIPAFIAIRSTQLWADFTAHLIVPDLWLSKHMLPERFNPHQHWLVLRHGIPQLCLLLTFGLLLGLMGMATYLGMILIHLFHCKRIGKVSENIEHFYPWISGLHWAHWSPLQPVFLTVMVLATLLCQRYLPEVPWTSLIHFL
ncbi:J domain-containing protein [Pseudomonas sp. ArH3a]|uniref:J domain-containing protein n=1 Tax=Pseudomonas sp. ArH3a TaxID=2862945 RepID=UPI001F58B0D6|nr:J domain-containing protein [Pseudomonas sp. ArH3a]UNM21495.1 J domain-containing protein [Pseudomonas sp. ArH3a]